MFKVYITLLHFYYIYYTLIIFMLEDLCQKYCFNLPYILLFNYKSASAYFGGISFKGQFNHPQLSHWALLTDLQLQPQQHTSAVQQNQESRCSEAWPPWSA